MPKKVPHNLTLTPEYVKVIREFLGPHMSLSSFIDANLASMVDAIERSGALELSKDCRTASQFLNVAATLMDPYQLVDFVDLVQGGNENENKGDDCEDGN